jgi:uncharacterized membrane protein YqjE
MESRQSGASAGPHHLLVGVIGIAKNVFGLLLNRVELAAVEFSEVRANFLKLALVFALGIVVSWFAIAYWSALAVVLAWESLGWKILAIIAALFTALALWIFFYVRAMLARDELSMPTTMSELRNDRDAFL